ncbi:MAG: hypothetical protein WDN49_24315 [Acetobacteraceae bacterium]
MTASPTRWGRRGWASCRWSAWRPAIANAVHHATGVRVREPADPAGGRAGLTGGHWRDRGCGVALAVETLQRG